MTDKEKIKILTEALMVYANKQNWICAEWEGIRSPRVVALDALRMTK